jgi:Zn-dependent peptidase ImmA (M78 family)/DNA-binding XRE family transcriptional regulator
MLDFNFERFKEIRIARKMTLEQIAELLGLSKQAVSKYEHGLSVPKPEMLNKIAKTLDVPLLCLSSTSLAMENASSILFFRTKSDTPGKDIEYAGITCRWIYEIARGIEVFEKNPKTNIPAFDENLGISEKAQYLRNYWGLGTSPVKNLTNILEENGIVIALIESPKTRTETSKFNTDSYSQIVAGLPIIVLNKCKDNAVRQRFNLAHELGHLVLHSKLSKTEFKLNRNAIEDEAHLFANMFLLPADSFNNMVNSFELEHFMELKDIWKVSIAAMLYRCEQANILQSEQVQKIRFQMIHLFGRTWEPYDDVIPLEIPHFLAERLERNIRDKDSFDKFYNLVKLPLHDIETLSGLTHGYFSRYYIAETTNVVPANEGQLELDLF